MPRTAGNRILAMVLAETWRSFRTSFRGLEAIIEVVSTVIFVLGITLMIAVQNPSMLRKPEVIKDISWGVIVFVMISDKLWILGHGLEREKKNKILENVLATNTPIWIHTLSSVPSAMIWTLASVAIASLTVFPMLGVNPIPADPGTFVAGYILSEAMASGIALIYSIAAMIMRKPWIATNAIQFTLPAISGLIPYEYAPQYIREAMIMNPLSYPVEMLRRGASGTPYMPLDTDQIIIYSLMGIAAIYAVGIISTSYVSRRMRRKPTA